MLHDSDREDWYLHCICIGYLIVRFECNSNAVTKSFLLLTVISAYFGSMQKSHFSQLKSSSWIVFAWCYMLINSSSSTCVCFILLKHEHELLTSNFCCDRCTLHSGRRIVYIIYIVDGSLFTGSLSYIWNIVNTIRHLLVTHTNPKAHPHALT